MTGRCDQIDRIVGLEMGADDYVTKPLELRELVVRVKNLLWRIDLARPTPQNASENCYMFSGYCLNVMNHTLEHNGEAIAYARGVRAAAGLCDQPGKVLHRERLLRMLSARRVETPDLRTIDVWFAAYAIKLRRSCWSHSMAKATFSLGGVLIQIDGPKSRRR